MAYTKLQISKLRRALHRYSMAKAHNGLPRSWRLVRDDILYSHKTLHEFPEDGSKPVFKYEPLRRFAIGYKKQVLEKDKLEDVYIFLYDKGYLPDSDWLEDEDLLKGFQASHDYLANFNPEATRLLKTISRDYFASRMLDGRRKNIKLNISADPLGSFAHVTEIVTLDKAQRGRGGSDEKDPEITRYGFGLAATPRNAIYLFLRSYEMEIDVLYTEIDSANYQDKSAAFAMMRTGDGWDGGTSRDMLPAMLRNVFVFESGQKAILDENPVDEIVAQWGNFKKIYSGMGFKGAKGPVKAKSPAENGYQYSGDFGQAIREGLFDINKGTLPFLDDPNIQDAKGMTPLHHAAAVGARQVIRMLVKTGRCDYLIRDKWGRYASDLAYEWGSDPGIARLLAIKQTKLAQERGVPAWIPPDRT